MTVDVNIFKEEIEKLKQFRDQENERTRELTRPIQDQLVAERECLDTELRKKGLPLLEMVKQLVDIYNKKSEFIRKQTIEAQLANERKRLEDERSQKGAFLRGVERLAVNGQVYTPEAEYKFKVRCDERLAPQDYQLVSETPRRREGGANFIILGGELDKKEAKGSFFRPHPNNLAAGKIKKLFFQPNPDNLAAYSFRAEDCRSHKKNDSIVSAPPGLMKYMGIPVLSEVAELQIELPFDANIFKQEYEQLKQFKGQEEERLALLSSQIKSAQEQLVSDLQQKAEPMLKLVEELVSEINANVQLLREKNSGKYRGKYELKVSNEISDILGPYYNPLSLNLVDKNSPDGKSGFLGQNWDKGKEVTLLPNSSYPKGYKFRVDLEDRLTANKFGPKSLYTDSTQALMDLLENFPSSYKNLPKNCTTTDLEPPPKPQLVSPESVELVASSTLKRSWCSIS